MFAPDDQGVMKSLRGSRIELEETPTATGTEITRLKFLDDFEVDLRDTTNPLTALRPQWHLRIFRDSDIFWPRG